MSTSLSDRDPDAVKTRVSAKHVAVMAVFIALAAVGSLIKFPSGVGTIALDSAPGYLVALGFSGWMGAVCAGVGHLLSAGLTGFPLSLPVHSAIAIGMAVSAWLISPFRRCGKFGWVMGCIAAVIWTTFILNLIMVPIAGWAAYVANLLPLLVASIINVTIAACAWLVLRGTHLLDQ